MRGGVGEFRSFLNPAACSRWASNFPEALAFVRGVLVETATAPELFRLLVTDCRVNPFLFTTDGRSVLFACLSNRVEDREEISVSQRIALLPTVQRFLRQIVVLREPLVDLDTLVDHRYDRPFSELPKKEDSRVETD